MNKENYLTLLFKKLKGDISLEEQSMLDVWTSQSIDNEKLAKTIEKDWLLTEQYEAPSEIEVDITADFKLLQERIERDNNLVESVQDNLRIAHQPIGKVVGLNTKKSSNRWLGWAAAAVVALAVGFWFTAQPTIATIDQLAANTQYQEQKTITLADGTKVWLNGNSQLSYPASFTGEQRSVQLTGEAFFEVTKNPNQPFVITTDKTKVTVLGTSFNVRAIIAENATEVVVKTGKVRFENSTGDKQVELTANEKGVYDASNNRIEETAEEDMNEIAWQSGKLVFKNIPLKEVIEDLNRQFEVTIKVLNTDLNTCEYTSLDKTATGIKPILASIASNFEMTIKTLGDTSFELVGGICKK
ncbi:MAG: FecR family protein [Saprospiraceae bacterium]